MIGRAIDCDVRLGDPTVGRQHALIDSSASVTLSDLNSTNGTSVNGRRLDADEVSSCMTVTSSAWPIPSFASARRAAGAPSRSIASLPQPP